MILNRALLFCALSLLPVSIASAQSSSIRVVLIGGQSNADGRADSSTLPAALKSPQDDVPYFYHTKGSASAGTLTTVRPGSPEQGGGTFFGPEITMADQLSSYAASMAPDTSIAFIKYATGGTNLAVQWAAGGTVGTSGDGAEYLTFQNTVTAGLSALHTAFPSASISLAGMVWMQGESDVLNATYTANYETNLTNFIGDIRLTYGNDLPFVIGRLSNGQTSLDSTRLTTVRGAQDDVSAALPDVGLVNTDGYGMKSDNLHFNTSGQQALGAAFANQLIALGAVPEPSPAIILSGLAVLAAFRRRR